MTEDAFLADCRQRLNQLRKELEGVAETGDASAATVELDQSKVGRLSRMDAMQAQAMAKASAGRRRAALRRIEAAMERIANGDFGHCIECEEAINPRRLEFDPTALRCIDCANKAENR